MSAQRNLVEVLVASGGSTIEQLMDELGWDYVATYDLLAELQASYVVKRRKITGGYHYEAACRDYGGKAWWVRRVAVCDMFRDFDGMTASDLTELCQFADRNMTQTVLLGMYRDGLLRREDEGAGHRYWRVSRPVIAAEHRRLIKYRQDLLVDNAFKRAEMRQRVLARKEGEEELLETNGEMTTPEVYQRMLIEQPPAPEQVVSALRHGPMEVTKLCRRLDLSQPKVLVTVHQLIDEGQVALGNGRVGLRARAK